MKRIALKPSLLTFAAAGLVLASCGSQEPKGPVGKVAPKFKVSPIVPRGDVTLASLKGKVVVLDFWATYCGPCRMLMPAIDRMQTKYGKDGLVVLGISGEERQTVSEFHQQNPELSYELFLDPMGRASNDYGADAIPTTVVIGKDGKIAYYEQGYSEESVGQLEEHIKEELAKS